MICCLREEKLLDKRAITVTTPTLETIYTNFSERMLPRLQRLPFMQGYQRVFMLITLYEAFLS